jgi:hypothetical protein
MRRFILTLVLVVLDALTVEELEIVPDGVALLLGLAPGESVGDGVAPTTPATNTPAA